VLRSRVWWNPLQGCFEAAERHVIQPFLNLHKEN